MRPSYAEALGKGLPVSPSGDRSHGNFSLGKEKLPVAVFPGPGIQLTFTRSVYYTNKTALWFH